jgi:enoyl-CoA hydratase
VERDDAGLAVMTLDSPPLNLFDRAMFEGLQAGIADVEGDLPRALLIRADGRAVSGGVNVAEFEGLTPGRASALWDEWIGAVERVEALPLPVVFAAHALTLTAAFELALGCDLILAARSAQFGLVEKVVGLTPSMGGTQRLAERAGSGRAREFVMTGELFGAKQLEGWGVVSRVFEDEGFDERARAFAAELAAGPTKAARDDEASPAPLSRGRHPSRRRGDPHRSRRSLRHRGPAARGQDLPRARRAGPRHVRGSLRASGAPFAPCERIKRTGTG